MKKGYRTVPDNTGWFLLLLVAGQSGIASAIDVAPVTRLDPIAATGQGEGYVESVASTGTKTAAPVLETPLTESVISRQLIKDRGMLTPNDLSDAVAGVQPLVGYGNTASQWFLIRGFDNQSINYRDDFRVSEPFTSSPRDLANVETVEFVKGPASVLYGAAQPGGAVNTITKAPLDYDYTYGALSVGSHQFVRETLDLNRTLGDVALRLNVANDRSNSYIDLQSSKNYLIAPALRWKVAPGAELLYKGEYQRTRFDGIANGLPNLPFVVNLPASYTYAEPWTTLSNANQSHLLDFKLALDDTWTLREGLYYGVTHRSYNFVNPAFATDPVSPSNGYGAALDGSNVQRYSYAGPTDNPRNTSSQTELTGTIHQGALTHTVLGGVEFAKTVFDFMAAGDVLDTANSATFSPGTVPPLAIFNSYNYPGGFFGSKSESSSRALYVQDQLAYGHWRLLAGARNEQVRTAADTYKDATGLIKRRKAQEESATTSRLGLLYLLTPDTSVYYSYGQSFVPNLGTDATLAQFAAERGMQHEIGLKVQMQPQLLFTLSAFDIVKRNVLTADPAHPRFNVAIGEVESKGVEASLVGQVSASLRVIVNASLINAKVTKDPGNPAQVGSKLVGVPQYSGNVWAVQDLDVGLPGKWSVGAGLVHQDARAAAMPNLSYFALPAYNSLDLGVFTKIGKVDVALNIKNVTNAVILTSQEGDNVVRQADRNFLLTVGLPF